MVWVGEMCVADSWGSGVVLYMSPDSVVEGTHCIGSVLEASIMLMQAHIVLAHEIPLMV